MELPSGSWMLENKVVTVSLIYVGNKQISSIKIIGATINCHSVTTWERLSKISALTLLGKIYTPTIVHGIPLLYLSVISKSGNYFEYMICTYFNCNQVGAWKRSNNGKTYLLRFFFSGVSCTWAFILYVFSWKFSKASETASTCTISSIASIMRR